MRGSPVQGPDLPAPGESLVMIHVDDLGVTHGSNVAFQRLSEAGRVDSGSVMVPCPWFPELAEAAAANPGLDVGVHLTLTSEKRHYRWRPLTRPPASAGLVDGDGFLPATVGDLVARAHPEAVEAELRAQVDAALAAGVDVTHLDDHMGAVLAPAFVDIFVGLGQDYGVPILLPRSMDAYGPIHNLAGVADATAHEERAARVEAAGGLLADRVLETAWSGDEPAELRWGRCIDAAGEPGFTLLLPHADLPGGIEEIEPETARYRLEDYAYFASDAAGRRLAEMRARRITPRMLRDRLRARKAADVTAPEGRH